MASGFCVAWQENQQWADVVSDIVSLQQFRKVVLKKKGKQSTLCGNGFHSWEVVKDSVFNVKQGKLMTQYRCKRCGAEKNQAQ